MTHTLQTAVGGLSIGAVYALVALGFSILFRTMGLVNFGHADIMMVGAFLASTFFVSDHLPFAAALVCATIAVAAMGFGFERVLRPLERRDLDLMLIGTIGFGVILEGVALVIWGSVGRAVPTPIRDTPFHLGSVVIRAYDVLVLCAAAAVMVALYVFLNHTKRGAAMQAAAMDYDAATAVGINVPSCNGQAFALAGALAAIGGTLVGPLVYVSVGMGGPIGIRGFAAAILGGFGNIPGAIVGGLIFGLIQSFAQGSNYGAYTDVITFLVFTAVIMVKPTGLLGEQTVSRP